MEAELIGLEVDKYSAIRNSQNVASRNAACFQDNSNITLQMLGGPEVCLHPHGATSLDLLFILLVLET